MTMHGNSNGPIQVHRIYISYDDGRKVRLQIPELEFRIDSGDIVKEFPITLTGIGLDERQHHKVPYIIMTMSSGNHMFWLKNSGPVW